MTVSETLLIFAGIPAGVMLVFFLLVFGLSSGGGGRDRRYRPGLPYEFSPVWFLGPDAPAEPVAGSGPLSQGGAHDTW